MGDVTRRRGWVLATVAGLVLGMVAAMLIDTGRSTPSARAGTSSDGSASDAEPSPTTPITPVPVDPTPSVTASGPPLGAVVDATSPPELLIWSANGLPSTIGPALRTLPALAASTIVRGDDVHLTASWTPTGTVVDHTAPGWYLPLDAFAVDPASYGRSSRAGAAVAAALGGSGVGGARPDLGRPPPRRGRQPRSRSATTTVLTVTAIVPDADVAAAELVVSYATGMQLGIDHRARRARALHRQPGRARTGGDRLDAEGHRHPLPLPGRDHLPAPRRRRAAPVAGQAAVRRVRRASARRHPARARPGVGVGQHRRRRPPGARPHAVQPPDRADGRGRAAGAGRRRADRPGRPGPVRGAATTPGSSGRVGVLPATPGASRSTSTWPPTRSAPRAVRTPGSSRSCAGGAGVGRRLAAPRPMHFEYLTPPLRSPPGQRCPAGRGKTGGRRRRTGVADHLEAIAAHRAAMRPGTSPACAPCVVVPSTGRCGDTLLSGMCAIDGRGSIDPGGRGARWSLDALLRPPRPAARSIARRRAAPPARSGRAAPAPPRRRPRPVAGRSTRPAGADAEPWDYRRDRHHEGACVGARMRSRPHRPLRADGLEALLTSCGMAAVTTVVALIERSTATGRSSSTSSTYHETRHLLATGAARRRLHVVPSQLVAAIGALAPAAVVVDAVLELARRAGGRPRSVVRPRSVGAPPGGPDGGPVPSRRRQLGLLDGDPTGRAPAAPVHGGLVRPPDRRGREPRQARPARPRSGDRRRDRRPRPRRLALDRLREHLGTNVTDLSCLQLLRPAPRSARGPAGPRRRATPNWS